MRVAHSSLRIAPKPGRAATIAVVRDDQWWCPETMGLKHKKLIWSSPANRPRTRRCSSSPQDDQVTGSRTAVAGVSLSPMVNGRIVKGHANPTGTALKRESHLLVLSGFRSLMTVICPMVKLAVVAPAREVQVKKPPGCWRSHIIVRVGTINGRGPWSSGWCDLPTTVLRVNGQVEGQGYQLYSPGPLCPAC